MHGAFMSAATLMVRHVEVSQCPVQKEGTTYPKHPGELCRSLVPISPKDPVIVLTKNYGSKTISVFYFKNESSGYCSWTLSVVRSREIALGNMAC